MKLLVVSLALTIFAGSQAFVLQESDSKVAELVALGITDAFSASETLRSNRETIEQSDIGKALRPWIDSRADKVGQRRSALRDAIPQEVKEVYNQISTVLEDIWRKAEKDLRVLIQKASRETEAFSEALVHDLNPTLEKLDPNLQTWRQRIMDAAGELNEKLVNWPLEKLKPYAQEIPSKVQEVTDSLEPYVDQAQTSILAELEKAHDVMQRSASRILEVFNKHREAFNQWVQTSVFPADP